MDVTVADATKAAAVEIEVHLADEEPTSGQYLLDHADMTAGAGSLDVRLEDHRRTDPGGVADAEAQPSRVRDPLIGDAEFQQWQAVMAVPGVPDTLSIDRGVGIASEVGDGV